MLWSNATGTGLVDAAAVMIGATLIGNLGPLDVLRRWGRAEFRVEVNHCSRVGLAEVAEKLVRLVRTSGLDWWGDRVRVSVSIGEVTAGAGDTLESLETRFNRFLKAAAPAVAIAPQLRTPVKSPPTES
jgi:GGDEF domain-containing protein